MTTREMLPLGDAMVQCRGLSKSFGDLHVLRGINLDIQEGEVISIIGPSGSGKSTLLRILMTLEKPNGGHVYIHNESLFTEQANGKERPAGEKHLHKMRSKIGMVFQHFNLFPHKSVMGNVTEAPIHVNGLSRDEANEEALKFLRLVGLEDKADARPAQLSGGQKQRVAIARALALHPKLMLLDEITSALDPELVGGVLDLVRDIAKTREMTILIVTHEMRFARESSDRTLFFDHGIILEDDSPEVIFTSPKHERTQEFLSSVLRE